LNLGDNDIEEVKAETQLPKSLLFLKLKDNPVHLNSKLLSAYREPIV